MARERADGQEPGRRRRLGRVLTALGLGERASAPIQPAIPEVMQPFSTFIEIGKGTGQNEYVVPILSNMGFNVDKDLVTDEVTSRRDLISVIQAGDGLFALVENRNYRDTPVPQYSVVRMGDMSGRGRQIIGYLDYDPDEFPEDTRVNQAVTVGRQATGLNDPFMSREHFTVKLEGSRIIVSDRNSSNGTLIWSQPASPDQQVPEHYWAIQESPYSERFASNPDGRHH